MEEGIERESNGGNSSTALGDICRSKLEWFSVKAHLKPAFSDERVANESQLANQQSK